MSAFRQFRDLPDPVGTFEKLFRAALESLLPDLAASPWYVREREVVNLFVFGHLIPQFQLQSENLDIRQLGIEVPVQKLPKSIEARLDKPGELPLNEAPVPESPKPAKQALGKYADIVVWPHNKATLWQTCKPLVHIEWKHISCRTENPSYLEQEHADDICLLRHNRTLVNVSYAILTEWHPFPREWRMGQRDRHVKLTCKRISDAKEDPEVFFSLGVPATCSEGAITVLQGPHTKVRSRPQACPVCIPDSSAVPVCAVPGGTPRK